MHNHKIHTVCTSPIALDVYNINETNVKNRNQIYVDITYEHMNLHLIKIEVIKEF